ncbi:MAG: hypothetical protein J0I69_03265 [Altererythrobacter sp.]|nr:hypothetical protein [Altererythrobacter sp.]
MPARKHRTGEELEAWEARKAAHQVRMLIARETVKSLTGHTLLHLDEAAAMLGITKKSLRELEARARETGSYFPARVTLGQKITGFRLADMNALVESGMAPAPADELADA